MILTADKLMMELGYISISASTFDYLLNEINTSLINLDYSNIGRNISGKLATHARIEMYRNLLNIIPFPKELVVKAKDNLDEFNKAKNKRNKLIHGIWHTIEDDNISIDEFYLGKLTTDWCDTEKIDLNELKDLKEHLHILIQKQIQINLDILTKYRQIIDDDRKKEKKLSTFIRNMKSSDSDERT